ncbi:MAG: hybrid sensor histidine kinase/response regulator [Aggregatilineales bacterium]
MTTKASILVVEDDQHLLEGISTVLELEGYEVHTAENGQQALNWLRAAARPPDLIVSDIMMPVLDGLQLLTEVRREPAWLSIPFIFLTALGEKIDIQRGKRNGVDDYLVKPFDAADLVVAVEARLKRTQALSEAHRSEMSNLKRRILTILNHEFRTPLSLIVAYADMLNTQQAHLLSEDELITFLKGVNSGAVRLRRLIENFITLVELETGDAQRTHEQRKGPLIDIRALLEGACRAAFNGSHSHPYSINVLNTPPPFIADAEYLKFALQQLLENAAKFSPPGQPIDLGVCCDDATISLWVSDRGRGIPETQMGWIWEVFHQIDREVHEDQGAGTGLTIVRRIVELHGGTVTCTSVVNVGTTFTITLPLRPAF